MKVAVIGDRFTGAGFGLIGIKEIKTPENPAEAENFLTELVKSPEVGVIIIQKSIADEIESTIHTIRKEKGEYPIIIEMPGKVDHGGGGDSIERLIYLMTGASQRERGEET